MAFKYFLLGTQLFTWCSDSLCISISLAVPFFLEDCFNSSCRSCLLCAWAITCFPELSCLCFACWNEVYNVKNRVKFLSWRFPWTQIFLCQVGGKLQAEFLSDVCFCSTGGKYRRCAKWQQRAKFGLPCTKQTKPEAREVVLERDRIACRLPAQWSLNAVLWEDWFPSWAILGIFKSGSQCFLNCVTGNRPQRRRRFLDVKCIHGFTPPLPFRYNYTVKRNTEIRFIPSGSDFLICLFLVSVNLLQRSLESTAGGSKGHWTIYCNYF